MTASRLLERLLSQCLVIAVLVAGCRGAVPRPGPEKRPEPWRALIRDTPFADIGQANLERAKRLVDSLGRFAKSDKVAIAGLAAALYDHPDQQLGNSAAYLLAKAGRPGLEMLLVALGSDNEAAQQRASYGVTVDTVGRRVAAQRLAWLVRSDNDSVAKMASWALSVVAPKFKDKTVEILRPLRFETGYPQYQAAYQVGWLGPSASFAYPYLIRMLADTSDQARQVASDALRRAGPYARAELEKARLSRDERIRVQAMMLLNGMRSE